MTGQNLVIGVDGGGTSTRVRIARADGTVVSSAYGAGVNPNSGSDPLSALTDALTRALDGLSGEERNSIRVGVAGLAGYLSNPGQMTSAVAMAGKAAGLQCPMRVYSDLVVAYWSAFVKSRLEAPQKGTVLIAGTGAVAAVIRGVDVAQVIDGNGYLLGDHGAGAWLGVNVARAALDSASGRGPTSILEDLLFEGQDPQAWLGDFYSHPPRDVAALARLVDEAYEAGDQVGQEIVSRAIDELTTTALAAAGTISSDIVLVGSIAAGPNPVGRGLRAHLRAKGMNVLTGMTGLEGAVELASRHVEEQWPMT